MVADPIASEDLAAKKKKTLAFLCSVAAASLALVGVGVTMWNHEHQETSTRTVENAVQEITQRGTNTGQRSSATTKSSPARGVQDLLAALGVPAAVYGNYGLGQSTPDATQRVELANSLTVAVQNGKITQSEADAVLKAFDAGLVGLAPAPLVLEDNTSS